MDARSDGSAAGRVGGGARSSPLRTRTHSNVAAGSPAEGPAKRPGAVVLLSGGLDSATTLAIAIADGFAPLPVTFRYGQTHAAELAAAERVAASLGAPPPLVLPLPYDRIGGSALLGEGEIPAEPPGGAGTGGIPATYVPARNLAFLSLAVAIAEARGMRDIYIGVNALDSSGYPDCRLPFIEAFARAADLGTREGSTRGGTDVPWWRIRAPLVALGKAEIIRRGVELGLDHALTVSCYAADDEGRACGRCDACGLRRRGFAAAGIADPTRYR